jgi:Ca-activated chloride channel family protein
MAIATMGAALVSIGHAAPRAYQRAQGPVFRGGIDIVTLGLSVTDRRGNAITDLTREQIEIYEDGARQTVRYFASGEEGGTAPPLHIALLLDVSESMARDIEFTRAASIRLLSALRDAEDVTLVDFDDQVRVARFARPDFPRLVERIRRQKVEGFTALYDAVGVYLEGATGLGGRKVMVLYTDGGDTQSALRFTDVIDMLKASDVTVFSIGPLQQQSGFARNEPRAVLSQMAEVTGGMAFFVSDARQLDRIYAQIASEIRAQYTVGYVPSNGEADGHWRAIDVKVVARAEARTLRVRARHGYYAPYRVR